MNLSNDTTPDYFHAMTATEAPKPVVRAPRKFHRQPQGEQYAERTFHGPGGSVTSTAVSSFAVDLASFFAAREQ